MINFFNRNTNFTLVLGGGGARGLAHIGVIKVLEKNNLIPSLIVGTSMGALVGAIYSQTKNAIILEKKLSDFLSSNYFKHIGLEQFSEEAENTPQSIWHKLSANIRQRYLLSKSVLGAGAIAQSKLFESLRMLLLDVDIKSLSIPFATVSSDLISGKEIILNSGSLINAVAASSAIPGIIAPISIDSKLLVDGTVTSTIPVPAARILSQNPIIAVDVRKNIECVEKFSHGYDVIIRGNEITTYMLNQIHLKNANVVINPKVGSLYWNEFSKIDMCIKAGEEAAENLLPQIIKNIKKSKFRLFG